MVGMPTRKANSVAAARLPVPASIATKIVAAEREVPGNTPATACAMPTSTAAFQPIALLSGRRAASHSAPIIQKPPITSAHATGVVDSGSLKPSFTATRPSTQVTRNAQASLSA